MWKFIADMPSTNTRIALTLLIAFFTAVRYLLSGVAGTPAWEPSRAWLAWIGVMSGIDSLQFYAKRRTYKEGITVQKDVEDVPLAA